MGTRSVNIPTYTKQLGGIVDGSINYAAHQINNYTPIEASLQSAETTVETHDKSFGAIERVDSIKSFDDAKVTTGTNSIVIDAGATEANLINANYGSTALTGWASQTVDVTSISGAGVMWANTNTLVYQATSNTAARPSNCLRVFRFTNTAGTVVVEAKSFENAVEAEKHRFERDIEIQGILTARGNISFTGNTNTVYALPTNYHDFRVNYTDANTITGLAGSRVRSSDDTTDIIFTTDQTCVLNANGANGLDTGSEAANTWYYLYAIYNPTTLTSALLFSTVNEVVTGSITLPSGYTKKRQLRFAVRNDASGNIIPFVFLNQNTIQYKQEQNILTAGSAGTYTTVSASSFVPPISRRVLINGVASALSGSLGYVTLRETGETVVNLTGFYVNSVSAYSTSQFSQPLNASQQLDYTWNITAQSLTLTVSGFTVTEVK